jgi:hypothetical protein
MNQKMNPNSRTVDVRGIRAMAFSQHVATPPDNRRMAGSYAIGAAPV